MIINLKLKVKKLMIALKKTIAYSKSWRNSFWISLLLGFLLPTVLITLEPFDNNTNFSNKYILLSGYAFCIIIPVLAIHSIENFIFKKQKNRWFVINEILYILAALFFIFVCCFLYHFFLVSDLSVFSFSDIWDFMRSFGLPFTPIFIPFWLYLRSKFGIIELPNQNTNSTKIDETISINGENKSEVLRILESEFVYAQSQQNYVDIYFLADDKLHQKMMRSTLANIMEQLPNAWQVHRSYLVNLDYFKALKGNSRKRFMTISINDESIPISQKYYKALSERLSKSSQELQK